MKSISHLLFAITLLLPHAAHASIIAVDGAVPNVMDAGGTSENPAEYIIGNTASYNQNLASDNVGVGDSSSYNNLTIRYGSKLYNASATIGFGSNLDAALGNNNTVRVTGAGSAWISSASFFAGYYGSGNTLIIESGAYVSNTYGSIGYKSSSNNNTVTVTGAESTWNNANQLSVGELGSGNTLTIAAGASVSNGVGSIGNSPGSSNNSVLAAGAGSTWSSSYLIVGNYGSDNTLTISDGALVKAGALSISLNASDDNYIRLDGGYLALSGNQETTLANFIAAERFQLWDEGSGTWMTGALDDFLITYHTTNESGQAATGYNNLGGYTTITNLGTIPEPTGILLLLFGMSVCLTRRREGRTQNLTT